MALKCTVIARRVCCLASSAYDYFLRFVCLFDFDSMKPFHQCDGSCGKKFPTIKLGLEFFDGMISNKRIAVRHAASNQRRGK